MIFNLFKKKNKNIDSEEYVSILEEISKDEKKYGFNEKYANQEEQLLNIYGRANTFNKKIKMIIISDTHNCLNYEEFKSFVDSHSEYDVCFLLGDHSISDIEIILKCINKTKIFGLLGNHDFNYLEEFKISNLNGNYIKINDVSFLGIEGSYKYKPSSFPSFSQSESIKFLKDKDQVDFLISHDNRFDSLMEKNPAHQGLFGITYYLYKNRVPFHIHGHIHESYRKDMLNGTKEISVFMYEYIEL